MFKKILAGLVITFIAALVVLPGVLAADAASAQATAASTKSEVKPAAGAAAPAEEKKTDAAATEAPTFIAAPNTDAPVYDPNPDQAQTGGDQYAEYRPVIGGTLLPGVAQDLGRHRVLDGQSGENAAYAWLKADVLKKFANILIGWTAALAVVMIIIGAYKYLTAMGDAEQLKSAHHTITLSLVGVAVSLLAFAVVQVIINLEFTGTADQAITPDTQITEDTGVDYCAVLEPLFTAAVNGQTAKIPPANNQKPNIVWNDQQQGSTNAKTNSTGSSQANSTGSSQAETQKANIQWNDEKTNNQPAAAETVRMPPMSQANLLSADVNVKTNNGAVKADVNLSTSTTSATTSEAANKTVTSANGSSATSEKSADSGVDYVQTMCDFVAGTPKVTPCTYDFVQGKLQELAVPRTNQQFSYYDAAAQALKQNSIKADATGTTNVALYFYYNAQCSADHSLPQIKKESKFWQDLLVGAGLIALSEIFGKKNKDATNYLNKPTTTTPTKPITPVCGNYFKETGEDCDAGPKGTNYCGAPNTANACKKITGCGNSIVESGEDCDAGPAGNSYCGAPSTANACKVITTCGNYRVEKGEECDAGPNGSNICGVPGAANACKKIVGCGNGIIETGEQCDPGIAGSAFCGAPGEANACQKIIVDHGAPTHYPRPEPTGPYVDPVKTAKAGDYVTPVKTGGNNGNNGGAGGNTGSGNKSGNGNGGNGKNKTGTPTGNGDQNKQPNNGTDGGTNTNNGNPYDTGNNQTPDDGSNNGDQGSGDFDGVGDPRGLLAADALGKIDAPSDGSRGGLDNTGMSLFDRPLLLLAKLDGKAQTDKISPTADTNPLNKILPCYDGGGTSCDKQVELLPQSKFKEQLLPIIARFLIYAATSVAVVVFFVAGAMMVLSYGDAEMHKKAKYMIIWAIVGLAFAAAAYALVSGVLNTLSLGDLGGGGSSAEATATQDQPATDAKAPADDTPRDANRELQFDP